MNYTEQGDDFHGLSIKDLLEAREAYHVFLIRKKNVVGTAIGSYRIRKKGVPKEEPKTLENTEIRKNYSWPCVIVFVKDWIKEVNFGKKKQLLNDFLPQRLYLPDGRQIPVCVILARWQGGSSDVLPQMKFPGNVIGGGYPIMTTVQGKERWATLGCLVSDGRTIYGLTNAHVTGRPGETLLTVVNGNEKEIGFSSEKQCHKVPFNVLYENLTGKHTLVNLDIGLIEFDDINNVTSQVYGLDKVNGLADINHDTLSLNLIGCPVMGFGCASGLMKGEIVALFYRYASSGGYDCIADYLIGPRHFKQDTSVTPFAPAKGDSGTLLVIDNPGSIEHMKAIGVIWGGQKDINGVNNIRYGLATNLGTICKYLDVELLSDWNTGYDRYFGAYAHVVLPSLCADIVKDRRLRQLMQNNAANFSLPLDKTAIKQTRGMSKATFVPLSDVPDLVWKLRGGKYNRSKEGPNHFADLDQPNPENEGRTLLDLCKDRNNIDPDVWYQFYKDIGARQKGALPFRIAQLFEEMVRAASTKEVDKFVCAAGIMTHYVFDACMPMHISYMHHGNPDGTMITRKGKKIPLAYDVHDEFDNQLVEHFSEEIRRDLPGLVIKNKNTTKLLKVSKIKTTKDAAIAAYGLMENTVEYAKPSDIVSSFEELVEAETKDRWEELWRLYRDAILQAMAEGVVLAARLWEAAWKNGNGNENIQGTSAVPQDELKKLYETKEGFLDSVNLEKIKTVMTWDAD